MARRGLFVTFEGAEGSGKTTQIRRLARRLRGAGHDVVVTREPGGTRLGDALRRVLLDPASAGIPPLAELLLVTAARADHVDRVIRPALARGRVVLCDRYVDATVAYQGYGRGLDRDLIWRLHRLAPIGLLPDMTILLDIPVERGLSRAKRRNSRTDKREGRFEEESLAFHRRVATGYRRLAAGAKRRYRVVDGSGQPEAVAAEIARIVLPRVARRAAATPRGGKPRTHRRAARQGR